MARAVCEANGIHFEDTFTGFKFMAERVAAWEAAGSYKYIFAFEESYGYMVGDYVRDKDAVTASVLVAEMAAYYHLKGMTLLDAMDALYEKYGWYKEKTLNLVMPGLDGLAKMKALMDDLRSNLCAFMHRGRLPTACAVCYRDLMNAYGSSLSANRSLFPAFESARFTHRMTRMKASDIASNAAVFLPWLLIWAM